MIGGVIFWSAIALAAILVKRPRKKRRDNRDQGFPLTRKIEEKKR
jgi:hypothetical protein